MVKKKVKIIEIKKDIKVKEEKAKVKQVKKQEPKKIQSRIAKIPEIKRPLKNLSEIVQEGEPIPSVPVQKEEETRVQEKKEKLSINYEIKLRFFKLCTKE